MKSKIIMEKDNMQHDGLKIHNPLAFRYELGFAAFISTIVIIWALWPFLSVSNASYPYTTDGLGHLTRVKYITECFKELKWPSWFPYWYNGSTVMQYYPPLSFVLLAIVQAVTDNIMITFKFTVFMAQLIGSMGVWYFCYRFIGSRIGIIGGILYAVHPFLLRSLLCGGEIAQIPIFAITPWLLCFSLLLFKEPTSFRWLLVCITGALLILSQPMHAFLVSICIGIIVLVLLVERNISISDGLLWVAAIGLGAGLGAFWSMPGVTHLENISIPYMLPEASAVYAAVLSFFDPASRSSGGFYVSISMLLLSFCSIIQIKRNKLILPLLITMLIGIYLSFGEALPLYKLIPMHQSFVPRRFLSFSVLAAVILNVYLLKDIIARYQLGNYIYKTFYLILLSSMMILLAIDINPRTMIIQTDYFKEYQQELKQISVTSNPFEQGRFTWVYPDASQIAYFPMIQGLNMADGWTIEGTPHNRAIWLHNIAISAHCNDYVVKNLLEWNVRSLLVANKFDELQNGLKNQGFKVLNQGTGVSLFYNPAPSSYFMKQERDAIAIGLAAPGMVMNFPWMVQGRSVSLEDYNPKELAKFKLIYLIEPDVKDFKKFQKIVNELAEENKTIIVSMGRSITWPLNDIIPYWETIQSGAVLVPTPGSPINFNVALDPDPNGRAPAMGNLDEVWMELHEGDKRVPAVGYKKIGNNRIYYVGLSLGQQLNSYHGTEIKKLMEQLMDIAHPNKNFVPAAFPVTNAVWGHDGFSFSYNNPEPSSVLVSVTYTPRWKAKVDGENLEVSQLENLILVDLPAGSHTVSFHYGMTWVGRLGIVLSVFSLLIVIFIYRRFEDFDRFFAFMNTQIKRMVEGVGA